MTEHNQSYGDKNNEYAAEDQELEQALGHIWDIALENHLDPFPTNFEVAPANIVYQIGAYGIPGRFSHWTYGRAYRQMKTQYDYGLSKIYELVINSNPSQAFLLANNPPIDNKFVMAHVLGHTDFFKNNVTFANTRRDMPEAAARNAMRIQSYEDREGRMAVEQTLDAAIAIEQHIDPYHIHRLDRDQELKQWRDQAAKNAKPVRERDSEFDDLLPRSVSVEQNLGRQALAMMIPPAPDQDLLGFIRNHAPYLQDWQRDVVDIVRSESLYFYPQRRTKIMNEGWAAYWHKRIMREMGDRGLITDAENEAWWKLHSGVVGPSPRSINPYYLGMKIYEYIEDYYNGTLTDEETVQLKKEGIKTYPRYEGLLKDSPAMPHLREAMMYNDDQSFIRNYFNKIVADRTEMYIYEERHPSPYQQPELVVVEDSWMQIRDMLTRSMDNNGIPRIDVVNGDHNNTGDLYLKHQYDGRSLDPTYVEKTLPYIYELWKRNVYLETFDSSKSSFLVYTYNGETVKRQS